MAKKYVYLHASVKAFKVRLADVDKWAALTNAEKTQYLTNAIGIGRDLVHAQFARNSNLAMAVCHTSDKDLVLQVK